MELWIRSQDEEILVKVNNLSLVHDIDTWEIINSYADHQYWELGTYTTEARALEVLDEIATMIKNRYIVAPTTTIISKDEMANEYKRLNYLYSGEFIMENPPFEIKPISNDVIYYEMPKE